MIKNLTPTRSESRQSRQGAIVVAVLVALLAATMIGLTLVESVLAHHRQMQVMADRQQCFWLAESAVQRALERLGKSPEYPGETWTVPPKELAASHSGVVTIEVKRVTEPRAGRKIRVEARFPEQTVRQVVCQREVFVD